MQEIKKQCRRLAVQLEESELAREQLEDGSGSAGGVTRALRKRVATVEDRAWDDPLGIFQD